MKSGANLAEFLELQLESTPKEKNESKNTPAKLSKTSSILGDIEFDDSELLLLLEENEWDDLCTPNKKNSENDNISNSLPIPLPSIAPAAESVPNHQQQHALSVPSSNMNENNQMKISRNNDPDNSDHHKQIEQEKNKSSIPIPSPPSTSIIPTTSVPPITSTTTSTSAATSSSSKPFQFSSITQQINANKSKIFNSTISNTLSVNGVQVIPNSNAKNNSIPRTSNQNTNLKSNNTVNSTNQSSPPLFNRYVSSPSIPPPASIHRWEEDRPTSIYQDNNNNDNNNNNEKNGKSKPIRKLPGPAGMLPSLVMAIFNLL